MPKSKNASLLSRNPLFRNFLLASTISLTGSSIFDFTIPLYVLHVTHSITDLALVSVAMTLPYFLLAPLTGYSVDNFSKRRIMLLADIGQIFCLCLLLAFIWNGPRSVAPIFVIVFVTKSLMTLFETVSSFQLIPALSQPQDLSRANMWFLSSHRIIQIAGPLLGGLLLTHFGIEICIILNILSFAATLFFTYKIKNLDQIISRGTFVVVETFPSWRVVYDNFLENLKFVFRSPVFRPLVGLMFLWNLAPLIPNSPSLTYYFTVHNHFSPTSYGAVVSLVGVVAILGYMRATLLYQQGGFSNIFFRSSLGQALTSILVLPLFAHPLLMALAFGASRLGGAVLTMGTFLLRQTQIPLEKVGSINSNLRMVFMAAAPLSALIQAFLIDRFGVFSSFVLGVLCLLGTAWFARQVTRGLKNHRLETLAA